MQQYLDDKYDLFIGGKWVKSQGGRTFDVANPANGDILAKCTDAVKEDIDEAVGAAWKAFESYKRSSLDERAEILRKIADRLEDNIELLAMTECLDNGKTLNEARGNVKFAIEFYRYCSGAVHTFEGKANMLADTTMSLVLREPIGVVGQIIPWNVPIILTAWKLGPVLATGCCTVLKPSNHAPLSTIEFIKCVADIIPPGVVNLVTGSGSKCGEYMLNHPGFRKLSFTGSTEVGKRVAMAAAEKLIPATLELGGKSVNIIFPDGNMDHALMAVKAFLVNAAQVCSAGSRLFLHEDIYDEFLEKAEKMYNGIKVGLPWENDIQMGALTYKEHLDSVLDYVDIGVKEGARIVCGGERITENGLDKGNFMRPTILADVTNDMRVAREEIFGRFWSRSNSRMKKKLLRWLMIINMALVVAYSLKILTALLGWLALLRLAGCGSIPMLR